MGPWFESSQQQAEKATGSTSELAGKCLQSTGMILCYVKEEEAWTAAVKTWCTEFSSYIK